MSSSPYTKDFYAARDAGSLSSATTVLEILFRQFKPRTVVDIGCGHGTWLAAAETLGSTRLKGIDGPWITKSDLIRPSIEFACVDFESGFSAGGPFDLCISVEVAEHVSPARAGEFVKTLCDTSDIVVFSAAIPGQGGTHHVNEQWQSHWIRLFDAHDYACHDIFRPAIWDKEIVDWWYRQNTFLFKRRGSSVDNLPTLSDSPAIADIVHPEHFRAKIESLKGAITNPSWRFCVDLLRRYLSLKARKVFHLGETK